MRITFVSLVLLASFATAAAQEEHSSLWYAEAQIACIGDATRLCGHFMPDQTRVTECMRTKQKVVSAACAAFYPGGSKAHDEN